MAVRNLLILVAIVLATPTTAQPYAQPAPQTLSPIDAMRAEFRAQSGGDTVLFLSGSAGLSAQSQARLAAEAAWLRRHPEVVVRIEGYGDWQDTRDHALALGARRAIGLRDYLVLLGVPQAQMSVMSWGRERGGAGRAVTVLVSALGSPVLGGPALIPGDR